MHYTPSVPACLHARATDQQRPAPQPRRDLRRCLSAEPAGRDFLRALRCLRRKSAARSRLSAFNRPSATMSSSRRTNASPGRGAVGSASMYRERDAQAERTGSVQAALLRALACHCAHVLGHSCEGLRHDSGRPAPSFLSTHCGTAGWTNSSLLGRTHEEDRAKASFAFVYGQQSCWR
jgi:hypothetical protein